MKQTAVEWLGNEITSRITRRNPHDTIIIQTQGEILIELIEQAKAMEKEQLIMFGAQCMVEVEKESGLGAIRIYEQYYNKTFKSE